MKNICLDSHIDLNILLGGVNHTMTDVVSMSIGYDDSVYILMSEKIPERINGMFVDTVANTRYYMLVLTVDWFSGELLHFEYGEFGKHRMNFHFIQPVEDRILLLGARTYNRQNGPENNAVIVDRDGRVAREMCLGDGIEDCLVTGDGRIITSYFDEGVFGNHGWTMPIGSSGLIVWDEFGNRIWKPDYPIYDCYAMNIDEKENLWFYYYNEFALVKTDFSADLVFHPEIKGASRFLLTKDTRQIIFNNGYNHYFEFTSALLQYDRISEYERCDVVYNDESLLLKGVKFRSSKALFLDKQGRLFAKDVIQL